jgi:hypothetical protein
MLAGRARAAELEVVGISLAIVPPGVDLFVGGRRDRDRSSAARPRREGRALREAPPRAALYSSPSAAAASSSVGHHGIRTELGAL